MQQDFDTIMWIGYYALLVSDRRLLLNAPERLV
jgi:hypothetical protein